MATTSTKSERRDDEGSSCDRLVKKSRLSTIELTPNLWDRLPVVLISLSSLQELDRRHHLHKTPPAAVASTELIPTTLCRFARHGGPNLSFLREV